MFSVSHSSKVTLHIKPSVFVNSLFYLNIKQGQVTLLSYPFDVTIVTCRAFSFDPFISLKHAKAAAGKL